MIQVIALFTLRICHSSLTTLSRRSYFCKSRCLLSVRSTCCSSLWSSTSVWTSPSLRYVIIQQDPIRRVIFGNKHTRIELSWSDDVWHTGLIGTTCVTSWKLIWWNETFWFWSSAIIVFNELDKAWRNRSMYLTVMLVSDALKGKKDPVYGIEISAQFLYTTEFDTCCGTVICWVS